MKKILLFLLSLFPLLCIGQTMLSPGELVVLNTNADEFDGFSFMSLVNLDAGTQVHFTDLGWDTNTGAFRLLEQGGGTGDMCTYTVPSGGLTYAVISSNNTPVVTAPSAPTVTEDATNVALADDIQVADPDGDDQTVTFTITGGTLTIGTAGSIIFSSGSNGSNSFSATGTLADINTALDAATFSPTPNLFGTNVATISFTSHDGTVASSAAMVSFNITGVNDDPAITGLPTDITVTEDVASNVDLSAATVSDVDAGANNIVLTIASGDGILTASSGGSVTIGGSGTGTITLTGTFANIDTYLNTPSNMLYTGALNVNGDDATTLSLTANDGGNSGSGGGGNVALGTVNVDITSVNDDPVIIGLPTDITVTEDVASNVDLSSATVSDADAGANNIVLTIAAGSGTLTASSGGSVTVGGSGTGTITLTGTFANINTYLNTSSNMLYTGALNVSGDDATTLSLTANDGGNSGSGGGGNVALGTVNVDITSVNDSPTLTATGTNPNYVEGVAGSDLYSTATVSTVESGQTIVQLILTVDHINDGSSEILSIDGSELALTDGNSLTTSTNGMAASVSVSSTTATVTLSEVGGVSTAEMQTLVEGITYHNNSDNPDNSLNRVVTLISMKDDGGILNGGDDDTVLSVVSTVTLTPVNDPPVVVGIFGDTSSEVIVGAGAQNVTGMDDAVVSNVDSPDYNGGFLSIVQSTGTVNGSYGVDGTFATSGGDAAISSSETIAVGGVGIGIVHAANDGQGGNTLQITFNASATGARIQTLLRNFTYSAPSVPDARTFILTLNDADGVGNGGDEDASGNFLITATPNPPVLTNIDGDNPLIPIGGKGYIDVDSNSGINDADSPNFNTGKFSIIQNTGTANGNFLFDGTNVTSGGDATIAANETIAVGGIDIGIVDASNDGQGGNDLIVTFNADATPVRTQTLLRNIKYAAVSGPGDRTFAITVYDASVISNSANITITMVPPEMDIKQNTTAIADGGTYDFGSCAINSNTDVVFTILNPSESALSITTPLTIGGADAGQFSIQLQPSSTVVNDYTTFVLRFTPTSAGFKTATIAITNNDPDENPYNLTLTGTGEEPLVSLSFDDVSILENGEMTLLRATLSSSFSTDVTVNLNIAGDASLNEDYLLSSSSITIPAGQLTGSVSINTLSDELDEVNEQILVTIASVTNGRVGANAEQKLEIYDQDQRIIFGVLPVVAYGDSDFYVDVQSTAGLAVSLKSSNTNVAVVDGYEVTIVGAGTCNISASQSGAGLIDRAPTRVRTLLVNKAQLDVKAETLTRVYGEVNPELIISYSGFVNGEDEASLGQRPMVSTEATADSDAGDYRIAASGGADDNYEFIYIDGTLIINKALQYITFNELPEVNEGDEPLVLTATATSGLDVYYECSSSELAYVEDGCVVIVEAGTVLITAKQAGNQNYLAAAEVEQMLIINFATGIEELTLSEPLFYPNPVTRMLYLNEACLGATSVKLYNLNGGLVLSEPNPTLQIDCSAINRGVYLIVVDLGEGKRYIEKMIKE